MVSSRSFIATPPGATIREQLNDRNMSQKEFSKRMGLSEKHVSNLINGDVQLTPDMAVKLEMVLGVPAQFWNNLESIYREKLVKAIEENEMDEDIDLAKMYPYNEMSKNNWVPETRNPKERVINLRKFFEVVRLSLIQNDLAPRIACRRLSEGNKADCALVAWAQRAKLEARKIATNSINIKKLEGSLQEIRKMTKLNPKEFCPRLVALLADCGIALVFLPHIGGSFLHGATFYDKNKIVIGLTVRGKDADKFWFSMFHEIAHILMGHIAQPEGTTEADEKDADLFAKDTLIRNDKFENFVSKEDFSKNAMKEFANDVDIDVGIVVGRLQKEGYIKYSWCNELKTQYVLV